MYEAELPRHTTRLARWWRAAVVTAWLTVSTTAAAEHGYVGDNDPWVIAVGPVARQRATLDGDAITLGATLRVGRALGSVVELRGGLEATWGDGGGPAVSAGAVMGDAEPTDLQRVLTSQ